MADCYRPSLLQVQQRPLHIPQLQAYFTHKLPVQAYGKLVNSRLMWYLEKKAEQSQTISQASGKIGVLRTGSYNFNVTSEKL